MSEDSTRTRLTWEERNPANYKVEISDVSKLRSTLEKLQQPITSGQENSAPKNSTAR